jgi:hypothetical protein
MKRCRTAGSSPLSIPENFILLHQGEEHTRQQSLSFMQADQALILHFDVLERSMNLIEYFARSWETQDEDDITLQFLGVRLFNSSAASINLLLSGYYQASASLAREVLETSYLVDLLANDKEAVARWRKASEEERKKQFGPIHVRMALDARDGLTSKARAAHYALLSKVASHATPEGFRLLRPGSGQPAKIGPFFNAETLGAVLSELAKVVIPAAGHFRRHFDPRSHVLTDFEVLFHFIEGTARWFERFFGRPVNKKEIEDVRATLQMAQELARREAERKAADAPADRDE